MKDFRIKTSPSIDKIAKAMVNAQREIDYASKKAKNPFFKSTYADLPEVIDTIKQPLNNNGIGYFQPLGSTLDGKTTIITLLLHESGEFIETEVPIEGVEKDYKKGPKGEILVETGHITPQKIAAAVTYYRRIVLLSLLGVPTEDDDGNIASGKSSKNNTDKVIKKSPVNNDNESLDVQAPANFNDNYKLTDLVDGTLMTLSKEKVYEYINDFIIKLRTIEDIDTYGKWKNSNKKEILRYAKLNNGDAVELSRRFDLTSKRITAEFEIEKPKQEIENG